MSGRSSGGPDPSRPAQVMPSANLNQGGQLDTFLKTKYSQDLTPDQIKQLQNAGYNGQDYYSGTGWGEVNINPLVSRFNAWKEQQARSAGQYQQYVTLSKEQPGRAQTVLAGAGVTNPKNTVIG